MNIPVTYIFNFPKSKIKEALKRLICSVNSILNQTDKIFILNASEENIWLSNINPFVFKDYNKEQWDINKKITYIHKPAAGYFNKSVLSNYLIKNYLTDYEYVCLSDIDIVYPSTYLKRMSEHISDTPVRVMPRNLLTPKDIEYSSDYKQLLETTKRTNQHPHGQARGLGLVHIPSYISIKGMNEYYKGYAPEDLSLNTRLEKFGNKVIFDSSIQEIHLYHEYVNREYTKENEALWLKEQEKMKNGKVIFNTTWGEY